MVRGDFAPIKIGAGTQVEDNCVIHSGEPLTIGDHVHIGHSVVVHCRRVGSHVLVGNSATILDGAEVGSYCIISAGSLISPKAVIPDHSFVSGAPAEVRGQPTAAQLEFIENGVKVYGEIARLYKDQGL